MLHANCTPIGNPLKFLHRPAQALREIFLLGCAVQTSLGAAQLDTPWKPFKITLHTLQTMEATTKDAFAVRVFALDYLGTVLPDLDDLFRDAWSQFAFTREEIAEAGRRLGSVGKKLDGASYVMRPHNLSPSGGPADAAHRFIGTASEGNAA